jgi:hypothetical protein
VSLASVWDEALSAVEKESRSGRDEGDTKDVRGDGDEGERESERERERLKEKG